VTPTGLPDPPDASRFRAWMGRWATGVSVVTAHAAEHEAGLTVNALLSVSLRPPSLLVSLTNDADTLPVIEGSGHFGVSILAADQRPVSERFALAVPAAEKFTGVPFHRGPAGSPLLDGTLAGAECRVVSRTVAFDHVLLLGEVFYLEVGRDAPPLVFYRSGYAAAEGSDRLRFGPARP
jgi:3-hydroxy-9,10-secoandrosta-1,3,5(10)-triene-9,17-dione monooxygenase reductase component